MDALGFSLIEGEEIVQAIKPLPALKTYFFLTSFFALIFLFLFLGIWIAIPLIFLTGFNTGIFLALLIFLIVPTLIAYVSASWTYDKTNYWITNKRIAVKRGFIGYSINSIPFERISDVVISRSFVESLFGFGSLHIQSLAGQFSYQPGSRFGAEGMLLAVPNPEELQHKIFSLIKENREKQHLTM
ncbi:MAG: PH domain-containing protein [Candidatus Diapherotrites archaeon]|nr:PH domain-containing protein [Candidatus Diapherotrites archaeon]